MSGKTYVGNASGVAKVPKKIYAGNSSNVAKAVKVVYCGNSSGKAVEVWRNSTLPSTYQKVEYIFNTGKTEYINIGVKPNSDTRAEIEFKRVSYSNNGALFGVENYSDNKYYSVAFGNGSQINPVCAFGPQTMSLDTVYLNTKYKLYFNQPGGEFYLDGGTKKTSTMTFSAFDYPIILFGRYYISGPNGSTRTIEPSTDGFYVYHFVVKQANSIIRDMYPCYLKSDTQVVGMYDVANSQLYGNNGTGIFYKGPDID